MTESLFSSPCTVIEAGRHRQCEGSGHIKVFFFERGTRVLFNEGTDRFARCFPTDARLSQNRIGNPDMRQTVVCIESMRTSWVIELPDESTAASLVAAIKTGHDREGFCG